MPDAEALAGSPLVNTRSSGSSLRRGNTVLMDGEPSTESVLAMLANLYHSANAALARCSDSAQQAPK